MSESDIKDPKRPWSWGAFLALLLSIVAMMASLFWHVIWRSPFHRFAEPKFIMVLAAVAFAVSAIVAFTLRSGDRKGNWMTWIALALSFGALIRSPGPVAEPFSEPNEPNIPSPVDINIPPDINPPPDVNLPTEPNIPDTSSIIEGNEAITRIADGRFAGFVGLVGDLRAGLFDTVYEYFSPDLSQQWPKERFVEDMNDFRTNIGPRWHVRPDGFAAGYDESTERLLCAVVLTDANDYQLFAELSSTSDETFTIDRLTLRRLHLTDEALTEKLYIRTAEFVNALLSGNYMIALLLTEPQSGPKPSAESLAHVRNAIRGGTWKTPKVVYLPPTESIEMGRHLYSLDAVAQPPGIGRLQLNLWMALPDEPAIDSIQYFAPPDPNAQSDPNE